MQSSREGYVVDTDPSKIDLGVIYEFLHTSYWANHRTREQIAKSWENATVQFGLYDSAGAMVGGCRVLSDSVSYAWLGDVFVLQEHRGQGLGKFLVACVVEHPATRDVEQFHLGTLDAHGLYEQFGWQPPLNTNRLMVRVRD